MSSDQSAEVYESFATPIFCTKVSQAEVGCGGSAGSPDLLTPESGVFSLESSALDNVDAEGWWCWWLSVRFALSWLPLAPLVLLGGFKLRAASQRMGLLFVQNE
jgi:hypothetical protein